MEGKDKVNISQENKYDLAIARTKELNGLIGSNPKLQIIANQCVVRGYQLDLVLEFIKARIELDEIIKSNPKMEATVNKYVSSYWDLTQVLKLVKAKIKIDKLTAANPNLETLVDENSYMNPIEVLKIIEAQNKTENNEF
jgi:hypothetical protein